MSFLAAALPLNRVAAQSNTGPAFAITLPGVELEKWVNPHLQPLRPTYFRLLNARNPQGDLMFVADPATDFNVWLDDNILDEQNKQHRALALEISSSIDENVKDKIVLNIVKTNGPDRLDASGKNGPAYLSVDFKLPPGYALPHAWLLHLQVWQCCGGVPPFSIHVEPSTKTNGPVRFDFQVVDDESAEHAGSASPTKTIGSVGIQRDRWYRLGLKLNPGFDGSTGDPGIIAWLDGDKVLEWNGHWGLKPVEATSTSVQRTQDMGIDVGIYRRRQIGQQTIVFSRIAFSYNSSALGEVKP